MSLILKLMNVRLSYPKLGEPEYFKGEKQKANDKRRWSAAFHVGPDSTAQFVVNKVATGAPVSAKGFIDAALKRLAEETWNDKASFKLTNLLPDPKACCWLDGARKEVDGGVWILSAIRTEDKGRPFVLDNDLSPIYKPTHELYEGKAGRIYGGCYVNAQVELWGQKAPAPEGLRCALMVVQRLRDGDSFGGGSVTDAGAFGEVTDGAAADDLS